MSFANETTKTAAQSALYDLLRAMLAYFWLNWIIPVVTPWVTKSTEMTANAALAWAALLGVIVLFVAFMAFDTIKARLRHPKEFKVPDGVEWDNVQLEEVVGKTFDSETIVLDGKRFINCTFGNVVLIFDGRARFAFEPCHYTPPIRFRSNHPAVKLFNTVEHQFRQVDGLTAKLEMRDSSGGVYPAPSAQILGIRITPVSNPSEANLIIKPTEPKKNDSKNGETK